MKKALALFLALVVFAAMFASCGGSGEESKEESSQAPAVSAVSADESAVEEPSEEVSVYVPDIYSGRDYEGETFTVWTTFSLPVYTSSIVPNEPGTFEENLSEGCNVAIKNRNNKIFETLGVTINEVYYYSTTRYGNDTLGKIRNYISTGDQSISAFACSLYDCGVMALEGDCYDLNSLDNFNSENPWWNQNLNECVTLGGRLYFTLGDMDYNSYSRLSCILYNERLINDLQLESPASLARRGDWTLDKLAEYSRMYIEDINDPEGIDVYDKFGLAGSYDTFYAMAYAGGVRILQYDKDGYPELSLYSEKNVNYINQFVDLVHDDTYVNSNEYFNVTSSPNELLWAAFKEGRCLFLSGSPRQVTLLEMDDVIGIVPYPKATKEQENYYSLLSTWTTNGYSICTNLDDAHAEFAGAVLDAMGYYSWRVLPDSFSQNYYEMTLKAQKLQTEEAEEMLDLIYAGRGFEPGEIFQIGRYSVHFTVNELYVSLYGGNLSDFTSAYDRLENGFESDVENLVRKIKSLEE